MRPRLAVASLGLTAVLAAAVACQSSAPYGAPGYAAAATGIAAAGAAASRASGGCWAECLPGSSCNAATGLCERRESHQPIASSPTPAPTTAGHPPLVTRAGGPYPPGHEYELPPASMVDAGCGPTSSGGDAGAALSCEMDAASSSF